MRIAQRIVVVGGGVLGTMHAVAARRRGYQVVHLEREGEARGASVRNFGLVWVSGRRAGAELTLALRARELWAELGAAVPGLHFRAAGSLTVATDEAELGVLKEAAARPDAVRRGFELLDPAAVREVNPALGGEVAGGLLCRADAIVEPRLALPALRSYLAGPGYDWRPGREATEIAPGAVRDHTGAWHHGDLVIVCPGSVFTGVVGRYLGLLARDGVRRVRLQMMQTAPMAERLDHGGRRRRLAALLPRLRPAGTQPAAASGAGRRPGPRAAADGPAGRRRPHHRRHALLRRAVRVRRGFRRLRPPAGPRRGAARRGHPARPAPLGRRLQRGRRRPPRFTTGPSPSPASCWSPVRAAGA